MSFAIVAIPNPTAWAILESKDNLKKSFIQALQFPLDKEEILFGRNEILDKLESLGFTEVEVKAKLPELQAVSRKQIVFHTSDGKIYIESVGHHDCLLNGEQIGKEKKYQFNVQDILCLNPSGKFSFQLMDDYKSQNKRKHEEESEKKTTTTQKKQKKEDKMEIEEKPSSNVNSVATSKSGKSGPDKTGTFVEFQQLCTEIESQSSYTKKTEIIKEFLKTFKGDVYLLCKLLLCREDKRVYNLREKAFANLLSRYLDDPSCSKQAILTDFEKGDMSLTSKKFLEKSGKARKNSTLTLRQVDEFLDKLTTVTKENEQLEVLTDIIKLCTGNDLKVFWKLIDKDLKINIGPKFVLNAMHPKAFDAYLNSSNLKLIIERVKDHTIDDFLKSEKENKKQQASSGKGESGGLESGISLMNPVKPMLARQTATVDELVTRCPNGMWAEIKYDGERLQIHKKGNEFQFFSRNLKKVLEWKVAPVREYVSKATTAKDIILDGEILLMDSENHKPLPFGTLGIHKKTQFKDATVCVFLFDILYFEGQSLLKTPLEQRRKLLEENIKLIPNRIEFSEVHKLDISQKTEFNTLMQRVLSEGLEGLVIKDRLSIYEPNMRHWNKIKKDYLQGMADSADLLVLGANYGTGRMGGLMSVFLMGVYDEDTKTFKTVCRCGNGHDDATITKLQKELKVIKISQDYSKKPDWLEVDKSYVPDFVVADPKKTQVWEIEGAEFTYSPKHTANAISIRVTKIRSDKDWESATNLRELKRIVKVSEQTKRLIFKPPDVKDASPEKSKNPKKETKKKSTSDDESTVPKKEEKAPQINKEALATLSQLEEYGDGPSLPPKIDDFELPERMDESGDEKKIKKEKVKNNSDDETEIKKPKKSTKKPTTPKPQPLKRVKKWTSHTTELTTEEPHPNYNEFITNILEQMGEIEKNTGNSVKHKAYMKAATALQIYPKKVESGAEAQKLDGIGKKIAKKIDEIIQTGSLQKLQKMKADPKIQAVNQLCKVSGVGPVMAAKLYDQYGIKTIPEMNKVRTELNRHQQVGLKYFEEFEERIPREEVAEVESIVNTILPEVNPKLIATICGSYRRKKATCGDIDMLLTHPDYTSQQPLPSFFRDVIGKLKSKGILTDDLSFGEVTYHGVCKLNKEGAKHRRMDILWIPYDQFFFGILYFTGSGFFNIQMRRIALEKGFTLNEKEILPIGETGICGDPIAVTSEQDIFDILGMKWREPEERDLAPTWKPTMS